MAKTILIADDEEAILKALTAELQIDKYNVLSAKDGQEALFLAFSKHPDLILLDYVMPKANGIEVLSKLRDDEWGKNVPVIFFTNVDTDDKALGQIIALNPSYYLVKNKVDISDLSNKIEDCLSRVI
jgi:two-component system, NtrC family, response regulator AtoC